MWIQDFVDCIEGSTSDQPRFAEALSIKEQHLPKRIYKYRRDCCNSRRNLETDTVWLSSPDSYNDPYDCSFRLSQDDLLVALENRILDTLVTGGNLQGVTAEQIESAKRSRNPLKTIVGCIRDSFSAGGELKLKVEFSSTRTPGVVKDTIDRVQQLRKLTKACSFSEINNSLLMWGHYADNHRGFCLEYNLEGLGADHRLRETLYPVVYTNQLYDLTRWALTLADRDTGRFNDEILILCVIYKCDEWKYEREWRMVRVSSTVENCLVPTPARVFLGSKMEAANVKDLRAICSYKGIEVWQMRLAEHKFELLPERLD